MGILRNTNNHLKKRISRKDKWDFIQRQNKLKLRKEFRVLPKEEFITNLKTIIRYIPTASDSSLTDLNQSIEFTQFVDTLVKDFPPSQLSDDLIFNSRAENKLSRIPRIKIENELMRFKLRHSRIEQRLIDIKNRIMEPRSKGILENAIQDINRIINDLEKGYCGYILDEDISIAANEIIKSFENTKKEVVELNQNLFTFDNNSVSIFAEPLKRNELKESISTSPQPTK